MDSVGLFRCFTSAILYSNVPVLVLVLAAGESRQIMRCPAVESHSILLEPSEVWEQCSRGLHSGCFAGKQRVCNHITVWYGLYHHIHYGLLITRFAYRPGYGARFHPRAGDNPSGSQVGAPCVLILGSRENPPILCILAPVKYL